jgi:tetratricopeptide (TPR) repeat protein
MNYEDKYLNACTLLNNGQMNESVKEFEEILSYDCIHHESINKIGVAFARQNKLDEALEMFNKCIDIKPDFAPAIVNIGNIYKQKSDNENALKFYNMATLVDENYYLAYYNIATAYKSMGNYDEYFKNIKKYKRLYKQYINNKQKFEARNVNRKHIYLTAIGITVVMALLIWSSRGI